MGGGLHDESGPAAPLPARTSARPEGERGVHWASVARHRGEGTRHVRAHSAARQRANLPYPRPGLVNTSRRRGYHISNMRTLSYVVALSLALPSASVAQVTTVDEGSFTITRGGTRPADRIGQESFTIRRTRGPGGDVVVANATVTFDTRHIAPALRTDTSFSPLAYQVEVRTG